MKTKTSNSRSQAKREKVVKVDWEFRRLKNQAIKFLAGSNKELRKSWNAAISRTRKWKDVERLVLNLRGRSTWDRLMNTFFGHEINKRVS